MCVSVPLSIFVVSQCVSLCDSVLPLHVCVSQAVFQAFFVCESHCVLLSQCVCVCISLYVYVSQCVSHSQFVCLRACLSECVSLSMCLSQCVCVALSESVSVS